ncbi:hypothetical protein FNQ90_07045 [Streptomyces alkaliphilus]|uniref:Uncharacterized protein n=1 Tax=Streptomyces alkaliphilus TaxID=1472722 RepID=A0A7W3Y0W1_9ACTN|nr:hypothetical protein [Streptomyces alkaliphilus]MBB0243868.1 hypothetical protein [Streptomyces alkaliphilus]
MKDIVAGHVALTATDHLELALGIDLELFLGVPDENEIERAARLDAARDMLADDPGLYARALRAVASHLPETSEVPVAVPFVAGVAA